MTDVFWLEQTDADLPADTDWLSADEAARANGMRFARRRADWLLGRWTAKCAMAQYWKALAQQPLLADIEIRSAVSGAPQVFLTGEAAAVAISLSHRAGRAMCAVATLDVALGCDLEIIEPRSGAFISDYFTTEEQALVAAATPADQSRVVTALWSAKESTLKALGLGLRVDTREVLVNLIDTYHRKLSSAGSYRPDPWRSLQVRYDGKIYSGWWQYTTSLLRTLVATPSSRIPLVLGKS